MTELTLNDDLRQTFVIMKYEFKKYLKGRRILIFGALVAVVLALLTTLPYLLGHELPDDPADLGVLYTAFVSLLVLVSATLFTSGTLSSEFEERTALVLFTKPLRKWSIYIGKYTTATILGIAFMLVYFVATSIVSLVVDGALPPHIVISFGLTILYVISTGGIAMMISSFTKKSSTSAILTFITLLLLISLVTGIMYTYGINTWFMLDDASGYISTCMNGTSGSGTAACVMVVWAAITSIIGYVLFKRREF